MSTRLRYTGDGYLGLSVYRWWECPACKSIYPELNGRPQANGRAITHCLCTPKEQKSMIDFTKPVRNKRGEPIRILCTDRPNTAYPVLGLRPDGTLDTFTRDGRYYNGSTAFQEADLENVPDPVYVNIYKSESGKLFIGDIYPSRAKADEVANRMASGRVACISANLEKYIGRFDE